MTETAQDVLQNKLDWNHPAACHANIVDADRCLIDWQGRTKLAIVGFASSSRELAPYDDPEWVIIGLNQLYRHIPRADAWFDIHWDYNQPNKVVEGTDYDGWLSSAPIPIFLIDRQSWIPGSVRYPIESIIEQFGIDYFTSTISFMLAYGIWSGFSTIGLWGVDLIVGQEYDYQKACAEFWLGVAMGRGVDLILPPQSALCKPSHRYGYEPEPNWGIIKESHLEARLKRYAEQRAKLVAELQTVDGAAQEADYLISLYNGTDEHIPVAKTKMQERLGNYRTRHKELYDQVLMVDGASQEAGYIASAMALKKRGGEFHI